MKFRQIALGVNDLATAVESYKLILETEPTAVFDPPGFAFFNLDGIRLLLEVDAPRALIYLAVADIDAAIARLRGHGFEVATEPHVVFPDDGGIFDAPGDEMLAFIADGQGNNIGLMSRRRGA